MVRGKRKTEALVKFMGLKYGESGKLGSSDIAAKALDKNADLVIIYACYYPKVIN